jgi:integrase
MLNGLARKLDGEPRASSVVLRWRKILYNAFEYAVEQQLLVTNPLPALKWRGPRTAAAVDRRVVANPVQVRSLLNTVRGLDPSGPRLLAFYGCIYYAALRPEEAAGLTKSCLSLPEHGWGELHLVKAEPYAGPDWTNDGGQRDRRGLKQRERGEVRTVPCHPELTRLLRDHLDTFGTAPDGRLFTGERNRAALPAGTTMRVWQRARQIAFTDPVAASPLAGRPYDLRHAAVSTWLNAGVPATTVAEWAGHSVEVLLKIYAKCLDGEAAAMRSRVEEALGHTRRHG